MAMETCVFILVMCATLVASQEQSPIYQQVFPPYNQTLMTQVQCTSKFNEMRNQINKQLKCKVPKEVYVPLLPRSASEGVFPPFAWVLRCVGICDVDGIYSCMPDAVTTRRLEVRLFSAETGKESCAIYDIEEHLSCQCCGPSDFSCSKAEYIDTENISSEDSNQ